MDRNNRRRIRPPFRLCGHILCTQPEAVAGIFWCFDLLKSGYAFVHIPTTESPKKLLLVREFIRNSVRRLSSCCKRRVHFLQQMLFHRGRLLRRHLRASGWWSMRKPRICILADFPNWAYDNAARQIRRQLANEFDIVIRYAVKKPPLSPEDYDLLHSCFWGENFYKPFGFDRERIVKEVSSHRWEDDPRYGPRTPHEFAARYLSDCDTVICTSHRLTEIVGKVFPRTYYTPNGVDTRRFHPRERKPKFGLVFGWAGDSNDAVKGFHDIVEPACGDRFALLAATGAVKHREMCEFYRKVDVFIVSSRNEGEPLTLIEAIASGCFTVCVDVGIVPEIIEHGRNGYIVRERSVEAFREAFEWCEKHRDVVRAGGLANAEYAARERNWKVCSEFFRNVYRETLARANRPLFRNDDVSWDTSLEHFREFCSIFHKYGQSQIHGVVLNGCTNVAHVHEEEAVEYERHKSVAELNYATIRRLSGGKAIAERTDLIDFINSGPDEVALHGLYHTDYSAMTEEEQERDINEGLALMNRLFPKKGIRFFIAPFNRTNAATYAVAARHGLVVAAAEGTHLEKELGRLVIRPRQWYRYHHHRFSLESRFSDYSLSLERLDAALYANFGSKSVVLRTPVRSAVRSLLASARYSLPSRQRLRSFLN